jgi:NAD(P)-dependent dehydrogenase (short-subunit alcohol dehydrogenase family)
MTSAPVLLITGGSRGLGAATAKLAATRGYDVAINYKRDRAAADAVVAAIKAAGRRAVAVQGDMANRAEVDRMFETVDKELGRLSHFVYSSGITGPVSRVEALEDADIREVIALNVEGAFYCARAAAPRISTKHGGPGGAIVLLSSMASVLGGGGEYVLYGASKGAIDSMTVGLSRELAGEGVRVNAVSPGLIDTEIQPPGRVERVGPSVPIGRAGHADEVAEAIVFLLSDAASYITGSILRVSGGR